MTLPGVLFGSNTTRYVHRYRCSKGHEWKTRGGVTFANEGICFEYTLPDGSKRELKNMCLFCVNELIEKLAMGVGVVEQVE